MKNNYLVPLKLAIKELRHGWNHFAVFLSCLVLGVTIMATVNTLGSVVNHSLTQQAQSLLGGDMEIKIKGMSATAEQALYFEKYGKVSYVATLRSMIRFKDKSTLIELKAIDTQYPLIGKLVFHEAGVQHVFKDNGIALDPLLLSQLGATLGDEVTIGSSTYIIRATVQREPDRAVQIFTFGPRVMMSQASLDASGLVSAFSLVEHRYRVLTPRNVLADDRYKERVDAELREQFPRTSWRVGTGSDGNESLERFLNQLIAFMGLSGLATFLIAGIGIGSSIRIYLEKKSSTIAVLKVQGASRFMILQIYTTVIGLLSLFGGVLGLSIAVIITSILIPLLATILPSIAGESSVHVPSSLLALWYGLLVSYLFSVPALFSAVEIRPTMLFRSKIAILSFSATKKSHCISLLLLTLLFGTLFFNANDKGIIIGTLVVISIAFVLFGFCTYIIKKTTRKIQVSQTVRVKTPWLKLALSNIHRPGSTTGTVVLAIGVSLTVLIALSLTEANFQTRIQRIAQSRAPSLFIVDIQPHQKVAINTLLREFATPDAITLSPMVRGRITHLASRPVAAVNIDEGVRWAIRGDRGISYSATAPANAQIVQGQWWPADYKGKPLLSVDERFLEGMDVVIGDTITVKILGEEITAQIANARRIDYSSFQLNFAMILSPGHIDEFPHTSLATLYLDKSSNQEAEVAKRIAQEFPGVMAIQTKDVIGLVQAMMNHIATALRVSVGISLFAGLLVLTSALSSTLKQRMYDIAILKVLGANRNDILKSCSAEWLFLALITSTVASVIGTCAAVLIHLRLDGHYFSFMPDIIFSTILLCMIIIWGIGFIGNRALFNVRPASLLRNE